MVCVIIVVVNALHTPNGKFDGLYEHLLMLKLKEENDTIRVSGD